MGAPSAPVIPGAGGRCIRTREHERLAGGYKGVTFMTKQNKKHRARHRGRHVQLYAYFATAVEAAKAFDGAVRRTIEVHKNLSYSGPLSDKQGYMFRAMLQIINFPTTEEKAFMRNYEQNWRRKPFELRLEDSESPRSRRRMRENRTSSAVKAKRRMSRRITASQRHPPCTSFARMLLLTSRRRRKREKA